MADSKYFDLPDEENSSQQASDRNRRRKNESRRWDLRSPIDRSRKTRLKITVNPDAPLSRHGIPIGNPLEIIRDVPEVTSRISKVGDTSAVDDSEDINLPFNADHASGLHKESPDLENCLVCQTKARRKAKRKAKEEGEKLQDQFEAHPAHIQAKIRVMVNSGVSLSDALLHVKKNKKLFGLPEDTTEKLEGFSEDKPKKQGTSAVLSLAEQLKGEPLEEWEKVLLKGKSLEQVRREMDKTLPTKEQIHSKKADNDELPEAPKTSGPVKRQKRDPDTGELVDWTTEDYIAHHTAMHKKAQAEGDTAKINYHLRQLRSLRGEGSSFKTVDDGPAPKLVKWDSAPLISRDAAIDSLIKADDTGEDQCYMKCRLSDIHAQCPSHSQLLTPE